MITSAIMPNTASLFFRSRSHASCQSEEPFSMGSAITGEIVGAEIILATTTQRHNGGWQARHDLCAFGSLWFSFQTSSRFQSHLRIHPRLRDVDEEVQQH